jgi:hypothetical protein
VLSCRLSGLVEGERQSERRPLQIGAEAFGSLNEGVKIELELHGLFPGFFGAKSVGLKSRRSASPVRLIENAELVKNKNNLFSALHIYIFLISCSRCIASILWLRLNFEKLNCFQNSAASCAA